MPIMGKYTQAHLMRLLKFKGQWVKVYHQFSTGRIDRGFLENLIVGPPATDLV